jgi:hypothetical protein
MRPLDLRVCLVDRRLRKLIRKLISSTLTDENTLY